MQSTYQTSHVNSNDPGTFNRIGPGNMLYMTEGGSISATRPSRAGTRPVPHVAGIRSEQVSQPPHDDAKHVYWNDHFGCTHDDEDDSDSSASTRDSGDGEDPYNRAIWPTGHISQILSKKQSNDHRFSSGPLPTRSQSGGGNRGLSEPFSVLPHRSNIQAVHRQPPLPDHGRLGDEARRQASTYPSVGQDTKRPEAQTSNMRSQAAGPISEIDRLRQALRARSSHIESLMNDTARLRSANNETQWSLTHCKSLLERKEAELKTASEQNAALQWQSDRSLSCARHLTDKTNADAQTISGLSAETRSLRSRISRQSAVLHDVFSKVAPLCEPR